MAGGGPGPTVSGPVSPEAGVFSGWGGQQDRCRAEPQAEEERGTPLQEDGSRAGGAAGGPWRVARVAATKMGGRKSSPSGSQRYPERSPLQPKLSALVAEAA